jgi:hypothetical protein
MNKRHQGRTVCHRDTDGCCSFQQQRASKRVSVGSLNIIARNYTVQINPLAGLYSHLVQLRNSVSTFVLKGPVIITLLFMSMGWEYVSEQQPQAAVYSQVIWYGELRWNDIDRGKLKNSENKPVPVPLYPPQISNGTIRARSRASAVRGQRLTAWVMVRPISFLLYTIHTLDLPPNVVVEWLILLHILEFPDSNLGPEIG